ncbi:TolC family protein [Oxalobacter formigenes]|uniref:Efflux transporter, outer membrane factor lipoprotein, NodT family n=1 Tax=Oxalobacter formigenes OXCC13 TaxID=556269 RepID=C3XCX4_OXAFO|nr:TolC family protein [Oxalobacter formigenes]ARQ47011.1 Toxin and drug export protein A [Oxalobacter formigenes]ARQ79042.1 transporter [Oxalobacter formigenes OXCC13]EEO28983.1 efflux transporter, outer membrane factor lipoprotein, NodT family [Oxalobacter formigenes OXCC13]MCZ4063524.1 TolC family protein [Oxalobacter formigenes]QDX32365.1 TolC family protein [Oxalobacter formigenes]
MRLIPCTLLCLIIAGCATQTTTIPDMGVIPQQTIVAGYKIDSEWWKTYHDENLNKLVAVALENNIDLKKSAITVNKALYEANLLGQNLVPEFSGSLGASVSNNMKAGQTSHNYTSELGVSYEIDLWRKLSSAASAQEWEYKATQQDMETTRLALINNIVDSYFHLVYLNQAIRVTEENIGFYTQLLQIINNKFTSGKVDALEPLTAEKSLLASRNSLMTLENNRKTVEQTLRNLLNLRPGDKLDIKTADILMTPATNVDLNVPISALGLRPDVKAAEYRIQSAFLDWESVKASVYPSVTIGSTLSTASNKSSSMFNVPFLGGTVNINLPFLQWNKIKWNIKISEADFENARLNLTSSVNTALNEVDTYYYSYEKSVSLLDNLSRRYDNDAKISVYNRMRYEAGATELKDWLDAKTSENSSMLSLLEGKYNTITYENAIYKSLGAKLSANQVSKP